MGSWDHLNVIDGDGHIAEPPDLWENYIDPKYRDTCPKIFISDDEMEYQFRIDDRISFSDRIAPKTPGIANSSRFGLRNGDVMPSYLHANPGGLDPHERVKWLKQEGFDATSLYPTMGLVAAIAVEDPDRQIAISNAYNRFIADFCKPYPNQLFGAALLPLLSVEACIKEVEVAKKLGLHAGLVRPNPTGGRALHDPAYYPLWKACEDMDFAIAVHGTAWMDNLGMDRFNSRNFENANETEHHLTGTNAKAKVNSFAMEHCFTHTAEMMAAVTSFVLGGVCDKFPKLRVAFVEGGGAWLPGYVDRMDRHFDDYDLNDMDLKTRPSEIVARQCYVSFEPVETSIKVLAESFGPKNLMVASDFPHSDGFPNSLKLVREMNLKPEVEKALLSEGFKTWYGLH